MSNKENRPTRRSRLLGDRPGSYAIARGVRMSPTKVRRVVDLVRGMPVTDALTVLKFAPQAASEPVYKVVASASANAAATEDLRAFGGPDYRSLFAVPGTITAANGQSFAIPAGQDGTALTAGDIHIL